MCNKTAYHAKWGCQPRYKHGRQYRKFRRRPLSSGWGFPPVNVQELDDSYELFLYAPGLTKADFQIHLKDDTLVISVDKKDKSDGEGPVWLRKEFNPSGFKRRFELNEGIDKENISAKYEDGMLQLTLPKLPGFKTSRQNITVE